MFKCCVALTDHSSFKVKVKIMSELINEFLTHLSFNGRHHLSSVPQ
jgi:hypothetical protein